MRFLKYIVGIFKTYNSHDVLISLGALVVILLMLLKLILFPYGLFGFGNEEIYTEGLVSKNGIQNINPLFIDYNEADREVSRLVFSGLMKYDPETEAIVDDMAVLTINEDKTEYTFKLREGLKWHDGKPITADDVYFTYHDIVMADGFPNEILKTNFAGIEIEQIDNMTVKFVLEKPNIFFLTNVTTGILPKHILKNVAPDELLQHNFNKNPIGSGPFTVLDPVERFSDGRNQITLTRSSTYYGEVPEIEEMRFIVYPSMEKLLEHINSVNGVVKITGEYVEDFEDTGRFKLIPYELPQYTAVFMNLESKILSEHKNVRLALQKAIDKEKLIEEFGDKVAVDTPLLELDQEDWVYQASTEQAQGALKEAGFEYQDEDTEKVGIRYNSDGDALELNLISLLPVLDSDQFAESQKVLEFLEQAWEGIGISLKVEQLPSEEFKQRVSSRQYDLLFVGHNLGYNLDTYSYWHSTQANPYGQNFSNLKSFRVDSLIEDIRAVFNLEKRERELQELAELIKDEIPAVFLYRPTYYYASDGKISNIEMEGVVFPSDRFSRIGEWTFE